MVIPIVENKMFSSSRTIAKVSSAAFRAASSLAASSRASAVPARLMGSAHEKQALGPKSVSLVDVEEKYAAHNYHPLPVVFAEGHGCRVRSVTK
jgi:hypothetical protein